MTDHYQRTVAFFDTAAVERQGYYDSGLKSTRTHLPQLRAVWRIALRLLGRQSSVLDVGCGRGDFTSRIPNAIGCDASPKAITLARSLYPLIRFEQADLRSLPFRDRTFAAAICVNTLHHILPADRSKALAEMARVADCVVVEFKNAHSLYYRGKRTQTFGDITVHLTDLHELAHDFAAAGFKRDKVVGIFGPLWLSPWAVVKFIRSP